MTDWQPDVAYCISLMRRADRRVALGNLNAKFGFPIHYFNATDGTALASDAVPSTWLGSREAYACMLSHRRVLESVPAQATVLVIEDDALVPPDMSIKLSQLVETLPTIWESVYLGGEHLRMPQWVRGDVVRCAYPFRTLGYILRGDAIKTAIEVTQRAVNHFDVPLGRALAQRGTCYAPAPFLLEPSPIDGDIPDSQPYGSSSF